MAKILVIKDGNCEGVIQPTIVGNLFTFTHNFHNAFENPLTITTNPNTQTLPISKNLNIGNRVVVVNFVLIQSMMELSNLDSHIIKQAVTYMGLGNMEFI